MTAAFRIGHGYDVHAFGPGDHVVVGGVRIPHTQGVVAHSDGDVALHALCDALLGAAGLGDIGRHFPDSDPAFADADSRGLVRAVLTRIRALGLRPNNADITVVAQAPRLGPHIPTMVERIAADLGLDLAAAPSCPVNVKATTTERLGFVGRVEGLAAHAVVSLVSDHM